MKHLLTCLSIFTVVFFTSCGPEKSEEKPDPEQYKENLLKVNETLAEIEDRQIEDYIARHGWQMQKSGTGLRYNIYIKTGGAQPVKKSKVVIAYSVSLLNGVECYNSDNDGLKQFEIGKAQVESGLEQGLCMMHKGEKAILIIPSHLAYGLAGDGNKIPKKATLVYNVELLEIH